jgi:RNA polymerase sigma-70 factor (ECF subfamily)
MTKTDADLLRASRRSAPAFRELYERYADRLYAYCLRRTRSADAAHDLTAETFAQAWAART